MNLYRVTVKIQGSPTPLEFWVRANNETDAINIAEAAVNTQNQMVSEAEFMIHEADIIE